jgi:hypothetical protein
VNTNPAGDTIATILRHDTKATSYKLALVRALTDLAVAFPDVGVDDRPVAVPLRLLADQWIAYFWPFAAPDAPIAQGQRATRDGATRQDMRFRPALTALRVAWEGAAGGPGDPADGFAAVAELRVPRRAATLPTAVRAAHEAAVAAIATALRMPIRYAGQGEWGIFARPGPLHDHRTAVIPIPGASPTDTCLVVDAPLWRTFRAMALWVDALCIHEWALFTERVTMRDDRPVDRGMAYRLLTAEPAARRPLTWERNQIRVLLLEGATFTCPWTGRSLAGETPYALDHLLPVAVLPINELWNLAPADPRFNTVEKRDRLPSTTRLAAALPHLTGTYLTYARSPTLGRALREDAALRFSRLPDDASAFPHGVARAAVGFIEGFARARNLARF